VAAERERHIEAADVMARIGRIHKRTLDLLRRAKSSGRPPHEVADELAREILRKARQAGTLARVGLASSRLARLGGWFYTAAELAVILYIAEEVDVREYLVPHSARLRVADGDQVLARYDDGAPALAERRLGEGTVLVWTSTLDALWNDLPLQPVFLPFVHALVRHASGRRETLPWLTAGQVVDVSDGRALVTAGLVDASDARLLEGEERVALTPTGRSLALPAGAGPHYLTLDEGGFYQIRPPGEVPERPLTVAVNVDLAESDLTALDPEEMVAGLRAGAGAEAGGGALSGDRAMELVREDRERRQSLWRFLLVAALGLLAVETVLSNRVSRAAAHT
ncbi:MAG: hypothetical protein KY453_07630, partial [Gemmatimonadetes bacterium]|nr:hypothetical protein [Gemmatimonadota bacterium]